MFFFINYLRGPLYMLMRLAFLALLAVEYCRHGRLDGRRGYHLGRQNIVAMELYVQIVSRADNTIHTWFRQLLEHTLLYTLHITGTRLRLLKWASFIFSVGIGYLHSLVGV